MKASSCRPRFGRRDLSDLRRRGCAIAGPRQLRSIRESGTAIVFAGELPPRVGRDRSTGVNYELEFIPRSDAALAGTERGQGGVRRVLVGYFDPTEWTRRRLRPVPRPGPRAVHRRAVSPAGRQLWPSRGFWSYLDGIDDGAVHFQRLLTNYDADAFPRLSTTSASAIGGSPGSPSSTVIPCGTMPRSAVGCGIDGYVFWDGGQVFREHSRPSASARSRTRSAFGLRLVSRRGVRISRIELRSQAVARISCGRSQPLAGLPAGEREGCMTVAYRFRCAEALVVLLLLFRCPARRRRAPGRTEPVRWHRGRSRGPLDRAAGRAAIPCRAVDLLRGGVRAPRGVRTQPAPARPPGRRALRGGEGSAPSANVNRSRRGAELELVHEPDRALPAAALRCSEPSGPTESRGPSTRASRGGWSAAKTQGVTPGFTIEDATRASVT